MSVFSIELPDVKRPAIAGSIALLLYLDLILGILVSTIHNPWLKIIAFAMLVCINICAIAVYRDNVRSNFWSSISHQLLVADTKVRQQHFKLESWSRIKGSFVIPGSDFTQDLDYIQVLWIADGARIVQCFPASNVIFTQGQNQVRFLQAEYNAQFGDHLARLDWGNRVEIGLQAPDALFRPPTEMLIESLLRSVSQ